MKIVITEDFAIDYTRIDARIIEVSANAKAFENEETNANQQIHAICNGIYHEMCEKLAPIAERYKTLCENTGWRHDIVADGICIDNNGTITLHVTSAYTSDWYGLLRSYIYYKGETTEYFKNFVESFDKENYLEHIVTAFDKAATAINEDINKKRAKKQEELNKFLGL